MTPARGASGATGQEALLSAKEFDLLACLMRHRGMALSRDLLLERVWGYDFIGDSRTVDVHVRWLREKIERDPSQPEYITDGARHRLPLSVARRSRCTPQLSDDRP